MNMSIRKATKRFQKPTYSTERAGAADAAVSGELDELLSKVPSLEERNEALRCVFEAFYDRFPIFQLAERKRLAQNLERLPVALFPVEHDHALHPDTVHEHRPHIFVPVGLRGVVLRNQPAHHDARI